MNQLTYHIAITRQEELLPQAAAYRLAGQVAAATNPALVQPATRSRRSSRWTIRRLAARYATATGLRRSQASEDKA
jgi:hypothetical protein